MTCPRKSKCSVCESPCRTDAQCCSFVCAQFARCKDLTGTRYGRLTVIRLVGQRISDCRDGKRSSYLWLCLCDCGMEHITSRDSLASGRANSCGCFRKETKNLFMPILHKICEMCGEVFLGIPRKKTCSKQCHKSYTQKYVMNYQQRKHQGKAMKELAILKTQLEELV